MTSSHPCLGRAAWWQSPRGACLHGWPPTQSLSTVALERIHRRVPMNDTGLKWQKTYL